MPSKPQITLYVDIVSPFGWLAFYALRNFSVFKGCEITYVPIFLGGLMKETGNRPPIQIKIRLNQPQNYTFTVALYFDTSMIIGNENDQEVVSSHSKTSFAVGIAVGCTLPLAVIILALYLRRRRKQSLEEEVVNEVKDYDCDKYLGLDSVHRPSFILKAGESKGSKKGRPGKPLPKTPTKADVEELRAERDLEKESKERRGTLTPQLEAFFNGEQVEKSEPSTIACDNSPPSGFEWVDNPPTSSEGQSKGGWRQFFRSGE